CDVDRPYDSSFNTPAKAIKRVSGDLLKRRSPGMAFSSMRQAIARSSGDWSLDPYNTFDWMMDVCERADKRIAFFFLCQNRDEVDARYELSEVYIKRLMNKIHVRSHEIGMHGSYDNYRNPDRIMKERNALLQACKSRGIDQNIAGNRQHYLRWDVAETPDYLDAAGFEYDTSGYFADSPGFRHGTSHPFAMWSWRQNKPLRLKQRPLVVMEDSVIGDYYLGMGYSEDSLKYMLALKKRSLQTGGDFTLLWHNSSLGSDAAKSMYRELVM
ncbi:MAG: polysaccharide deacetylase family protein, partial [Deltaproteobacteria bacterium]|nr:polysaccharide deacetylase family protein [Deltaproteobacteria bacterium]